MKNRSLIFAIALTAMFFIPSFWEGAGMGLFAQNNMGVNNTGALPNASALLDVNASPGNNMGLLIPRVTYTERTGANFNPLPVAAQGLTVYQTNAGGDGEGFYYNTSTTTAPTWVHIASTGTSVLPGVITAYGGASAPSGWFMCDGSAVSRATYAALFAVMGITYGAGDGVTTFNVPDLRQRFPLGKATAGTGSILGGTGGAIDHTHTGPSHTHSFTPAGTVSAPTFIGSAGTTASGGVDHTHTGPSHTHTYSDVIAHTHTIDPPSTASSSVSAGTPSGSISWDGAGTPTGSISSVSAGTPSGSISWDGAGTPTGSISSVSAGTPSGSISWNGAGTPSGTIGNSGFAGYNRIVYNNAFTLWTLNVNHIGGATYYITGLTSSQWAWTPDVHNHTFTGNALGTHSHTFSGNALAGHSHTFSGNALGTHSHTFSGNALGVHNHTFTGNALGTHSHTFTGNALAAHSHTTDILAFASSSTGVATGTTSADGTGTTGLASAYLHTHGFTPAGTNSAPTFAGSAGTTGAEGTGATGSNNPPFLVVNYIIKY